MSNYDFPRTLCNEQRIAGPYYLYEVSFILEFLHPHINRNCSVLMRYTYVVSQPLGKLAKAQSM